MKTLEWTPRGRSRVLGLIQGGRHSRSEISQITNIPKGTIGNLKKRNTPLNKVRSGHPPKLSIRDKRQIVFHITRNHESRRLSVMSIIQDRQLDTSITRLKCALKDLSLDSIAETSPCGGPWYYFVCKNEIPPSPTAERVKTGGSYHWTLLQRPLCAEAPSIILCEFYWNLPAPQQRGSPHSREGQNGRFHLDTRHSFVESGPIPGDKRGDSNSLTPSSALPISLLRNLASNRGL